VRLRVRRRPSLDAIDGLRIQAGQVRESLPRKSPIEAQALETLTETIQ
jgi:hypothetical protein